MPAWRIVCSFVLPALVLIGVPWLVHAFVEPLTVSNPWLLLSGSLLILVGLAFLAWTNMLFWAFGKGTLAPWDAPGKLVVLGPYRYVRNPMILAVVNVLLGETLVFNSFYLLGWAMVFWLLNHLWITQWEEPRLAVKFGTAYEAYKKQVPRWIPLNKAARYDPG